MAQNATMQLPTPPAAVEYSIDAWQRSILFLDVLRRRAAQAEEHAAQTAPHVLDYEAELVLDGRTSGTPGELRAHPNRPDRRRRHRPAEAAVRRGRPPRRPRSRHRRLQGRQRDRRGDEGRPPLLLRRLPARSRARPDHRGHRPRRGGVPGDRHRPPPGGRGKALRHRQLPGRLGDDDGERAPPGALRPDHHRGLAALLLGRRARQEPDALLGRPARWLVADRADRRPRRRRLRRRLAGAELREPEPGEHPLDQAVQRLVQDRHRGRALPWLREVLGRARAAQRRGNAVDRRRALRRQPPRRGRDPHLRRHRHRPAQHPLADRRLLLAGRQHHPAAAGARLDPRPLRQRRRDPRPRPDHRLHHPRQDRASRHLRLGGRRARRSTTSSPRTST